MTSNRAITLRSKSHACVLLRNTANNIRHGERGDMMTRRESSRQNAAEERQATGAMDSRRLQYSQPHDVNRGRTVAVVRRNHDPGSRLRGPVTRGLFGGGL